MGKQPEDCSAGQWLKRQGASWAERTWLLSIPPLLVWAASAMAMSLIPVLSVSPTHTLPWARELMDTEVNWVTPTPKYQVRSLEFINATLFRKWSLLVSFRILKWDFLEFLGWALSATYHRHLHKGEAGSSRHLEEVKTEIRTTNSHQKLCKARDLSH